MRLLLCVLLSAGLLSCKDVQGPSNADSLLVLKTDDIEKARLSVLAIAEKRGQLLESRLEGGIESQFTARLQIPPAAYYASVRELSGTGKLISETSKIALPAEDGSASSSVPAASSGTPPAAPTAAASPGGSASSPAATDAPKADAKGRLTIEVRITGPGSQDGLKIPAFREALIGVINAVLGLAYVMIWISPLLILYGLYRLLRKRRKTRPAQAAPAANKSGNPVTLD